MKRIKSTFIAFGLLLSLGLHAQDFSTENRFDKRVNLLFGTNQLLLGGFNVEGNLFLERWVFDYSHGVSLNLDNEFLDDTNKAFGIDVHIPWTTGFGVGYRFTEWLNLRAEPKWHKFELYQMGDPQTTDQLITSYRTFSLGLGAYANFRPFKRSNNFLKGIMIAPSVRWWPRVSSSLDDDQVTFNSRSLGQEVTHEALEVGISDTPWILNVSIGYSVPLR